LNERPRRGAWRCSPYTAVVTARRAAVSDKSHDGTAGARA
jgi:hypothetical protein